MDADRDAGIRVRTVVLTALVAGVVCWAGLRWWESGGRAVPVLPWLAILPLTMVASVVLVAGWQVKSSIGMRPDTLRERRAAVSPPRAAEITPQRARATLVAAQAAALGGAALTGWYLAHVLIHSPDIDVPAVQGWWWRAAVSALAAAGLTVAGLIAQQMCRLPPEQDDPARPHGR